MSKYTFIIPVFNVEKYLKECIDSVLTQTYKDFEIILVDDGSTDSSGKICDEYSKIHDCVTVYHKENGGLSKARNWGLNKATTEFVIFLDSDDYWNDKHGLEKIDRCIANHDVDVVIFASKDYYENTNIYKDDRYNYPTWLNECSAIDCLKGMISLGLLNMSAAKKVYRREFLIDNDLFFMEGIKSEDVEQGIRLINCLPNFRILNEKIYTYRHREGSISKTVDINHIIDYCNIIKKFACYKYVNEDVKMYILSYIGYQYALLLAHMSKIKDKKKRALIKEMKEYSYLLQYDKYPRTKIISKVYSVFGYTITRLLLCEYLKHKNV